MNDSSVRPTDLWEENLDSPWLFDMTLYELIKEFDEVRSRLTASHNLIARGYEQNDYSLIQLETDTGLEYEYDYYRDILKVFKLGYNINIEYSFNDDNVWNSVHHDFHMKPRHMTPRRTAPSSHEDVQPF